MTLHLVHRRALRQRFCDLCEGSLRVEVEVHDVNADGSDGVVVTKGEIHCPKCVVPARFFGGAAQNYVAN